MGGTIVPATLWIWSWSPIFASLRAHRLLAANLLVRAADPGKALVQVAAAKKFPNVALDWKQQQSHDQPNRCRVQVEFALRSKVGRLAA